MKKTWLIRGKDLTRWDFSGKKNGGGGGGKIIKDQAKAGRGKKNCRDRNPEGRTELKAIWQVGGKALGPL